MITESNPVPIEQTLIAKIENLEAQILAAHPSLPLLLRQIHTLIKENPATVTVLTEEQIGIIVSGLKIQTKTELVSASLKKTTVKSLKSATIDMI